MATIKIETINELESNLVEAFNSNDLFTIEKLMHEDLLFNTADGRTITRAMDLDNLKSGTMRIIGYLANDYKINIIGDTAVVAMTVALDATMAGNVLKGNFRMMRVWKLFGKSLKIVAMSGTMKAAA